MGQRGQPIREPVAFLRVVIHNAVIDDLRSARRRTQSLESCEDGADPASVDQFAQVEADDRLVDPIKQRRLLADYQDAYDLSHKEMDPVRLFLSLYVLAEQGHALPALPSGTDIPNARNNIDRAVVHAYLQLHPDRRRPDPTKPRWRSSRATDQTKFKKRLEAHLRNLLGGPDSS
jgi:hypothetical protein